MKREHFKSQRGATRLGFLDVIVALVLLGVLLAAAYLQFPIYHRTPPPPPTSSSARHPAPK